MSTAHPWRRVALIAVAVLVVAVVVLNWTYGRLPAEPSPTGSFTQVGNLKIHYIERPGKGAPVVLVHGLPGTAQDWDRVSPLLAGDRTVAIDRPGFGYSSGGYVPFDRQLRTIHRLLAGLRIRKPILVGHSYGGTVALGYAERYPGDVRGLVLVDAAAAGLEPDTMDTLEAHAIKVLQAPVIRQVSDVTFSQLLRTAAAKMGDDEAFAPEEVASAHEDRLLSINMAHSDLDALAGEELAAGGVIDDIDKGLGGIEVPAAVIQGTDDHLVGADYGKRLAARLPDGRLELLPGGHMQPYEHPAAVAAAIRRLR